MQDRYAKTKTSIYQTRWVVENRTFSAARLPASIFIDMNNDKYQTRLARIPAIVYPEELPIAAKRDEIARAIAAHQVVVVAGETGDRKSVV